MDVQLPSTVSLLQSPWETNRQSETLIWIDETLGMPVRSETTDGSEGSVKAIMEFNDISLSIDQHLFEIPHDYRKVSFDLIHQPRRNAEKARGQ